MRSNSCKIHLEIQTSRKSPVGVLRSSFHENGQTKHRQYGRIIGKSVEELKVLQLALRGKCVPAGSSDDLKILHSKEYGASSSIYSVANKIGLRKILQSVCDAKYVDSILAMVIGRIVYAGSKLSLCNQADNSSLWEIVGVTNKVDVDTNCYDAMDELLSVQDKIQKKLVNSHMKDGQLILYDITSSYLEGEYAESDLVKFGYNRDGKKGHEQIVIGLVCTNEGCPVLVEVFPGNTKDSTTVKYIIEKIKHEYGIQKIVFVGDRGMITKQNTQSMEDEDILLITALVRSDLKNLMIEKNIQMSIFDQTNMLEITDDNKMRYVLCRNNERATQDKETLETLLTNTITELKKIEECKMPTTPEIIGSRVGKVLNKWNTSKYITWKVEADEKDKKSINHKLIFSKNEPQIEKSKTLAGLYCIKSNVEANVMDAKQIVESYKNLMSVEKAFKNLKTVTLEIRPIYHRKDTRIKAHVFLCMLSYFIEWHMQQLLKPLTNSKENNGRNRIWTFTSIIETLKAITKNTCEISKTKVTKLSTPTDNQQKILDLLGVKLAMH